MPGDFPYSVWWCSLNPYLTIINALVGRVGQISGELFSQSSGFCGFVTTGKLPPGVSGQVSVPQCQGRCQYADVNKVRNI